MYYLLQITHFSVNENRILYKWSHKVKCGFQAEYTNRLLNFAEN